MKMAENDRSQWPEDNSAHAIFEINLLPVKFPKLAKMTFFQQKYMFLSLYLNESQFYNVSLYIHLIFEQDFSNETAWNNPE